MRLPIAASLLALLLAQPATAQEQRGAIEGTVQDAQHAMLPGAAIAALNLAQGTAISTTADATGTFRFPALAPEYYDVTASLPGFTAVKFERVEVLLGQIKRLSFVLEIAAVAETVRVSASSPLVDMRQSARVFSLRQDTIDLLPKGRDFTSLVKGRDGFWLLYLLPSLRSGDLPSAGCWRDWPSHAVSRSRRASLSPGASAHESSLRSQSHT